VVVWNITIQSVYGDELCVEQQKIQKQQVWGGSTTVKKQVAGTASSVAFTPLQVDFVQVWGCQFKC